MADGPPPPGWAVHTSRSTNKQYYFNSATGESSYENPSRRDQPSRPVSPPMAAYAAEDYGISYAAEDNSSSGGAEGAGRVAVDSAAAAVATAYDQVKDVGRAARSQSELIYFRRFQNWVKSVLIMACAPRECNSVLDLACGKLGDLAKWREKGVRRYVGMDISSESLANGARRFSSDNSGASMMTGRLVCADLGAVDLRCFPALAPDEQFDCISIQFALHYLFQSEARALTFFANIRDRLKPGGVFLGTIADSHALVRAMREEHAKQMRETAVAPPEDKDPFFWQKEERELDSAGEPGAKRPKTENQQHASARGATRDAADDGDAGPAAGKAATPSASSSSSSSSSAAGSAGGGKASKKRPRSKAASRDDDGSVAAEGTLEALAAKLAEPRPVIERQDPKYEAEGPVRRAGLDVDALRIGSDFCHVTFPKSTVARSYAAGADPFGMAYSFYLKEAVEHVTEYLVPPQLLERLARSVGLVPVEGVGRVHAGEGDVPPTPSDFAAGGCNFHQFFEAYGGRQGDPGAPSRASVGGAGVPPRDHYVRLLERMKVFDAGGTFNDAQWRAASLYRVFAFCREASVSPTLPVPAPRRPSPGKPLESATMLSRHSVLVVSPDGSCQGGGVAPLPPFEEETAEQRASRMPAGAKKPAATLPADTLFPNHGDDALAAAAVGKPAASSNQEGLPPTPKTSPSSASPSTASAAATLPPLGSAVGLPSLPAGLPLTAPAAPAPSSQGTAADHSAQAATTGAATSLTAAAPLPKSAEMVPVPAPVPAAEAGAAPFEEPAALQGFAAAAGEKAAAAAPDSALAIAEPGFSAADESALGDGGAGAADFGTPLDAGAHFQEPALPAVASAQGAAFGDIALADDAQDEPLFSYAGGDDDDELE